MTHGESNRVQNSSEAKLRTKARTHEHWDLIPDRANDVKSFVKKFVSEQWLMTCMPLATHLLATCNPHYCSKNAI